MGVLTSETCWALNNGIKKQVTSSWSLFIQLLTRFFTLPYKWHNFKKKLLNIKLCFNFLYKFCQKTFSFQEELITIWLKNTYCSSCKVPVILAIFSLHFNFLDIFSKNIHISNFMKSRPVESELLFTILRTRLTTKCFIIHFCIIFWYAIYTSPNNVSAPQCQYLPLYIAIFC